MNGEKLREYLRLLDGVYAGSGHSVGNLFSRGGLVQLACAASISGKLEQAQLIEIIQGQNTCPEVLYYSMYLIVIMLQSFLQNACSPVFGIAYGLSRFLADLGLSAVLNRNLYFWESIFVDTACYFVMKVVFGKQFGPRDILRRLLSSLIFQISHRVVVLVINQVLDSEQAGQYFSRAFLQAVQYLRDSR